MRRPDGSFTFHVMDSSENLWRRFALGLLWRGGVGLDLSRIRWDFDPVERHAALVDRATRDMAALEKGAKVNVDEGRQVGHYWLRAPELADTPETRHAIEATIAKVKSFAARVHSGALRPERAARFESLLVIGIGGSALGPQLAADALGSKDDKLQPRFFDNTDPDGIDRTLGEIARERDGLDQTLTVVISKSGGTKETRNGMLETQAAYRRAGLNFARHAVAVTGETGSSLAEVAAKESWIERFPMWDWVGGRTSITAAVGLLPLALQGVDTDELLRGAREMDAATRDPDGRKNPAMLLALAWYHATDGRGAKDMVILPYKDRLLLLSRYLQQLIMESLGKEKDLAGNVVHQGIAVYGNKGSTDQHAYVQQLREGVPNFFATFIEVLSDREGESMEVEPGVTSGDFLLGFLLGTRAALFEKGRDSITITIPAVTPRTLGALIALYERAVGLYASFVGINAYHQPGVEAGKKAAGRVIELQLKAVESLRKVAGRSSTAAQVAEAVGAPGEVETIHKVLEHLAANHRGVVKSTGDGPATHTYSWKA